ncbi:APC family permease [Mycobacterium xenopi]|uniref:Amino acid permease n=1 Tax=Mycobacterium xenopi TaxID=1789 RepID=A0AAD1H152_MYCXE|nr:amino acid permease [Mycobacterium xenopi]EUA35377.1 amino acid permease family protein [Mycobacterium xenopi 3993]MDA3641543.1 amino acid permease [Mycobacterium xenopi]MDA3659524.1 amino acid permease [Mycobacterium xenopi]MDA3664577.1 amino acid permease [Mycobacterium xenopi]ORX21089.1 amino acid permease [Mycobacterium xenopi]
MPTPALSLAQQMLRRRPVSGAPVAHGASDRLRRSLGTFQLTMFGVGSTVGTGIFVILSVSVPQAGPAVVISFILAGIAAGLTAICYAELASAVPVSGSAYSYSYAILGEFAAVGVAACLLLEYGVSTAAVAVGWSQYLNKLFSNVFGFQLPQAISAAPWDSEPGVINLPAIVLVAMCAALLIRGVSESAKANAVMVLIKLGVLLMFAAIAFTAFKTERFADFAPFGVSGISLAAGTIFFTYIGLDAVSTAGDEVKDPQHTMPRAIIAAMLIVTGFYVLVAVAAIGGQPWQEFKGQEADLSVILEHISGNVVGSTILAAGAVISIFSVTLVTMYGQTRILYAVGRDGLLPTTFAKVNPRMMTPVSNTVIVAGVLAILAGLVPLENLAEIVSIGTLTAFIVVSVGVIILRVREPDLPRGFKVPGYPITPILSVASCVYILSSLHWYTWIGFSVWLVVALIFYLVWGRRHSALNDRVNGGIGTVLPVEDVAAPNS